MKGKIILFALVFIALSVSSQKTFAQIDTLKTAKKFLKKVSFTKREMSLLDEAEFLYEERDFTAALPLFLQLEKEYTGEIFYKYRLGECYLYKPNELNKALEYLLIVEKELPEADNLEFNLGKAFFLHFDFDNAISRFENFIQIQPGDEKIEAAKKYIKNCENAKEIVNKPKDYLIVNLDTVINTPYAEYAPVFYGKNKMLLYTFRGDTNVFENRKKLINPMFDFYEDIYISYGKNNTNSKWSKPINASPKINSNYHDASASSSTDGKKFYLYKNLSKGKGNNGDIYEASYDDGVLGTPQPLQSINTKYWEGSVTTTDNDRIMIFSSERPGGFGGKDLYKSEKGADGNWTAPVNLGASVNTADNEDGPLFSTDGNTLYFSSDGHNSIGGYDIFKSQKTADGSFGKPENMGYPVNSLQDDIYMFLPLNESKFYFSSSRPGGFGMMDIYYFQQTVHTKEIKLIEVKGIVTEENKVLESNISVYIRNPIDNELVLQGVYHTNVFDGTYQVPLLSGQEYEIKVTADYSSEHQNIGIVDLKNATEPVFVKNVSLDKEEPVIVALANDKKEPTKDTKTETTTEAVKETKTTAETKVTKETKAVADANTTKASKGTKKKPTNDKLISAIDTVKNYPTTLDADMVYLKRVYYDFNRAVFTDAYVNYLDGLAVLMQNNPGVKLEITGHTDGKGSTEYNQNLSERRARIARAYLIRKGIALKRIVAKGEGETAMLADDKDGTLKKVADKNRRVEFKLYTPSNFKKAIKYEDNKPHTESNYSN